MRTALLAATAAVLFAVVSVTAASADVDLVGRLPRTGDGMRRLRRRQPRQPSSRRARCSASSTGRGRHAGLRQLRWSRLLADAAGSKADIIASCGDFSHHPCGTRWPASATRQTRYDIWGENLYYGHQDHREPTIGAARVARVAGAPRRSLRAIAGAISASPCDRRARSSATPPSRSGCSRSPAASSAGTRAGDRRSGGEPGERGRAESQAGDERRRSRRLRAPAGPAPAARPRRSGPARRRRRRASC